MIDEKANPGARGNASGAGKGGQEAPFHKDTDTLISAQGISSILGGFLASLGFPLDLRGIAWALRYALRFREGRE